MNCTRGKWEFYSGVGAPAVIVKGNKQPDKLICHARLFMGSEDLSESEANAHLISAAPDMYEALKMSKDALKTLLYEHPTDEIGIIQISVIDKALNKAEGKEENNE